MVNNLVFKANQKIYNNTRQTYSQSVHNAAFCAQKNCFGSKAHAVSVQACGRNCNPKATNNSTHNNGCRLSYLLSHRLTGSACLNFREVSSPDPFAKGVDLNNMCFPPCPLTLPWVAFRHTHRSHSPAAQPAPFHLQLRFENH